MPAQFKNEKDLGDPTLNNFSIPKTTDYNFVGVYKV